MNDPPASSYIGRQKKTLVLVQCSLNRFVLPALCSAVLWAGRYFLSLWSLRCALCQKSEEGDGPLGISEAMWMHRRAGVTVITFASFCCCSNGVCLTILLKKQVLSSCCFLFLLSLEAY